MAHFVKPKSAGKSASGYQQRADGVLTALSISGSETTKDVVLWGGGRGGELLNLIAYDNTGKRMADCYLFAKEAHHEYDPDGDNDWYYIHRIFPGDYPGKAGTLTAIDKKNMPFARIPLTIERVPISASNVSLLVDVEDTALSVDTTSFNQFRAPSKTAVRRTGGPTPAKKIIVRSASSTNIQMRIKVTRGGTVFWVGASVPQGTVDFSKAYIYFHPDTLEEEHNATYAAFGPRWEKLEKDYVSNVGAQVGEITKTVALVPFMTRASRSNSGSTNVFGDRGHATLDAIMRACAVAMEQAASKVTRVSVFSYSSGIDHSVRFADKVGGSGIIKEQFDLDGPYIRTKHSVLRVLKGTKNVVVSQASRSPTDATSEWIQLDRSVWNAGDLHIRKDVKTDDPVGDAVHANIGNQTIRALVSQSSIR